MITAARLHLLSNFNADQLSDLLLDAGYHNMDEPIITTHFDGVTMAGPDLNFAYQAQYLLNGLRFAKVIVSYNTDTGLTSADFQ